MNVHQISVFLENRAGQLAEITSLLAENNINIRAISIAETADYGVLRMIVDDAERASGILLEKGNILTMTPVSVVAVPDVLYSERPQLQNVTYDNYWKYESVLLDMLFNAL